MKPNEIDVTTSPKSKPATLSARVGIGAALLLAAAFAWAQSEELVVTFRKPTVDLKPYTQLLITPLNLSDARIVPPAWVERPAAREWDLTAENQEALRSAYARAVRAGIESAGEYKVVDAPAAGTLQVEVRLISLTPWAARNERATTLGTGSLSFEAHVRDASTAELLAIFHGTQPVGNEYQENTAFNRAAGLTEHFTNWGRNLSRRLTAARTQ
jgi:hypothetical protein